MHHTTPQPPILQAALRVGGACAMIGSLAVAAFRLAHGDPPAAFPEANFEFLSHHPFYSLIHLGTILGVLVWVGGFAFLTQTLTQGYAKLLGRLGLAAALAGAAVFVVEFSIDGFAGQALGQAWAAAAPAERADLILSAHLADTMLRGTSLCAIIVLWGVPLLLFGRAVMLEGYSAALGWIGVAAGAATVLGSVALLWQPGLFPGAIVYGLLASVIVQLWSCALGVAMQRRSAAPAAGA